MDYIWQAVKIFFIGMLFLAVLVWAPAFAIPVAVIAGALWYFNSYRPRQAAEVAAQQEATRLAEERRQARDAEEARERAAREQRTKQEKQMLDHQERLDDEARSGRLRSVVNELLDYANMLSPDADKAEIVGAMHATIGRLAEQKDIKAHHFEDDMLQFDIGLILRKLRESGLENDLVVDRLRKVLRQDGIQLPASISNVEPAPPRRQADDRLLEHRPAVPLPMASEQPPSVRGLDDEQSRPEERLQPDDLKHWLATLKKPN